MADQQHSSQDKNKGKGKAHARPEPSTSGHSASLPSVFTRLARSATVLGRDMVNSLPTNQDLSTLAAATSSSDKTTTTASPSSRSSDAYISLAPPAPSSSTAVTGTFFDGAQRHASAQEAEFSRFLEGVSTDGSIPTESIFGRSSDGSGDLQKSRTDTTASPAPAPAHAANSSSAVAIQESRDGVDVVNLLATSADDGSDDICTSELAEDEAAALHRILFRHNGIPTTVVATQAQEWDSVLNFIPDYVRPNADGSYEAQDSSTSASSTAPKSRDTLAALGVAHTPEATRVWLDQWQSVLTRYDDEVWGGLSPLVEQALEELEQLHHSTTPPSNAKALDRLRQILGHLRDDPRSH